MTSHSVPSVCGQARDKAELFRERYIILHQVSYFFQCESNWNWCLLYKYLNNNWSFRILNSVYVNMKREKVAFIYFMPVSLRHLGNTQAYLRIYVSWPPLFLHVFFFFFWYVLFCCYKYVVVKWGLIIVDMRSWLEWNYIANIAIAKMLPMCRLLNWF